MFSCLCWVIVKLRKSRKKRAAASKVFEEPMPSAHAEGTEAPAESHKPHSQDFSSILARIQLQQEAAEEAPAVTVAEVSYAHALHRFTATFMYRQCLNALHDLNMSPKP